MIRTPKFMLSALLILAMGAYLGINSKARKLSKIKTNEQYWADTGIKPQALEELLQGNSCRSSERYFLACANSVLSVAQKYGFDVAFDGTLMPLSKVAENQALTEKELLAPWKAFLYSHTEVPAFPFLQLWRELSTKHLEAHQLSYAVGLGMNGFLSVFKDPHTYLLPADFYNEVVAKTNHKSLSVGIVVGRDDKNYFVKKVLDSSASSLAGVKKGDLIITIQGQKASDLTTYELGDLLRGEEGSTLELTVLRKKKLQNISILRTEKTIPTVSSQVIEGIRAVGVVTINKFSPDTCMQTKATLRILNAQGIRGLLLDLRDNPGGQMEEAACVAGLFVGPGKMIFEAKVLDTTMDDETVYSQEDQVYAGPMAILINSGSASASEIVAGALQYYKRAVLVGERTFGKGSFQEGELWSKNDKVALFETKGFYYLPSGQTPQMAGLEPDVKVDFKDRFALREEDQFLNPLRAPQPALLSPVKNSGHESLDLVSCISLDNDFLPSEDPEMKEAHRVLSCRGIAEWGNR